MRLFTRENVCVKFRFGNLNAVLKHVRVEEHGSESTAWKARVGKHIRVGKHGGLRSTGGKARQGRIASDD